MQPDGRESMPFAAENMLIFFFFFLDQLIDHADQDIAQQRHGNQKHFVVGLSGGVVENGISHDGQDQHDGGDDFYNGIH